MRQGMKKFADAMKPAFNAKDSNAANKDRENGNLTTLHEFYLAVAERDYSKAVKQMTPDMSFEIFGPHPLEFASASGRIQQWAKPILFNHQIRLRHPMRPATTPQST